MKRKYFSILLAAMTIAASANVYAAPSIGQIIPEAPKVVEGNLSNKQELIVKMLIQVPTRIKKLQR